MSKKLILLMLALPLLIMLSLFTATNTVSLAVSVPVSKIEISSDPIVYLDLDEAETYTVEYTIYPTNAANQTVAFSTERLGEEPLAELEYNEGVITPKTCGKAIVYLTTADGGFKDSFITQVESNSLQAIDATVSDEVLDIGGTATITTVFTPVNAPNQQLRYEVTQGAELVSVNNQGVVTGKGVGTATVKVISRMNEAIYDEVTVEVKNSAAMQFVEDKLTNTTKQSGGAITLFIDENVEATPSVTVLDENGVATETAISYTIDIANKQLAYTFLDADFVGKITVQLTVNVEGVAPFVDSCIISRFDKMTAEWSEGGGPVLIELGSTLYIHFEWEPSSIEVEWDVDLSNDYVEYEMDIENGTLIVEAKKMGEIIEENNTLITLTLTDKENSDSAVTLTKIVVIHNF